MRTCKTSFGILSTLLLLVALGLSPALAQDATVEPDPPNEPDPDPPPPTGGPPGGKYRGPEDIVPSPNSVCNEQGPDLCDPGDFPNEPWGQCPYLNASWVLEKQEQCVSCDGGGAPCFKAKGYSLNLETLWGICPTSGPGYGECTPAPGDIITTCLKVENVCQVNVFESLWLNPVGFGYTPICNPVPLQVFINGSATLSPPQSFSRHEVNGLDCEPATVCLTFQARCLCDAVNRWTTAVWPHPDRYAKKWMFHIGFTTCESCDC